MDRQPTDGGLWVGATPSLSDPRSGCLLRRHIRPTRSLAWYSRSSDLCTFTLAERICGAFDWLNPPGMPGPYCCDRRATPAPHPHVLYGVLQRSPNASLIRQGCAGSKAHSARWAYRNAARPWWATSSIHADLICGRDSLDQMVIFGEAHLRQILNLYTCYYNESRTHLALQKDAPFHRVVQRSGGVVAIPILAGLHHQYVRI